MDICVKFRIQGSAALHERGLLIFSQIFRQTEFNILMSTDCQPIENYYINISINTNCYNKYFKKRSTDPNRPTAEFITNFARSPFSLFFPTALTRIFTKSLTRIKNII